MRLHWRVKSLIVRAYLRYLQLSGKHLVIGPYRGELGFEVLYWIPFLHWALTHAGQIPLDRCLALSRGGMAVFYPAGYQADLFTLRTVDQVRLENNRDLETRKLQKQTTRTAWDDAVCREAAEATWGQGCRYHVLHPAWMYWLFEDWWENRAGAEIITQHTRFEPLAVPTIPEGFVLPETFIAVRFYERHTYQLHGSVPRYTEQIVQALATHLPVVLLNQPEVCADDHVDLPLKGPNIFALPAVPAAQNFVLQAAVLARAAAFVGTYGGVAQWALRYHKPVLSYFTQFGGTAQAHRTLSAMLAAQYDVPFECSQLTALKLWAMALTRKEGHGHKAVEVASQAGVPAWQAVASPQSCEGAESQSDAARAGDLGADPREAAAVG